MTKRKVGLVLAFMLAVAGAPMCFGDELDDTRARAEREPDANRRARYEVRIAELLFERGSKQFSEGEPEKGLASLKEMLSTAEAAQERLFSTGKNPRRSPRGFKEAEIKWRELIGRLGDLKVTLPTEERPEIEKITARMQELQDELLKGLTLGKAPNK